LLTNGFESEGHTVRLEDQQISVVTTEEFLVTNVHTMGSVFFIMVRAAGDPLHHAHIWKAGVNYYQAEDPVRVVVETYEYFRHKAPEPDKARTEMHAVADGNIPFEKMSFAIQLLREVGYLDTQDGGRTYYCRRLVSNEGFLTDYDLLSAIMGRALPTSDGERPFFPSAPFLIQFDLVWAFPPKA